MKRDVMGKFEKGNKLRVGLKPSNAFPVGNIPFNFKGEIPRVITSKREGKYREITINDTKLAKSRGKTYLTKKRINYARYLYEKFKGTIPKGFVVVHWDRNKLNDSLNNLVAISRANLIRFNNGKLSFVKEKINTKRGVIE